MCRCASPHSQDRGVEGVEGRSDDDVRHIASGGCDESGGDVALLGLVRRQASCGSHHDHEAEQGQRVFFVRRWLGFAGGVQSSDREIGSVAIRRSPRPEAVPLEVGTHPFEASSRSGLSHTAGRWMAKGVVAG